MNVLGVAGGFAYVLGVVRGAGKGERSAFGGIVKDTLAVS
jgi:hypothetical protein